MTYEVEENGPKETDDNEDEVESPTNVRKGFGRGLQIHEIGQRNSRHAKTDAFSTNVIWEELRVEDHPCHIDTHAVNSKEQVEPGKSD